jgi:hypothetical protein
VKGKNNHYSSFCSLASTHPGFSKHYVFLNSLRRGGRGSFLKYKVSISYIQ